jgi:hypothetical protein
MSKKTQVGSPTGRLAKGQLWKLSHLYIQVVELGKKLIHYRMLTDEKESGARVKTSDVNVMWDYLKSRQAQLVQNNRSD